MRVVLVVVALLAGCGRRNFNDGEIDAAVATDATDATDAAGNWALPGWGARQPATITLPTGSVLDDFPVLVRLTNGMNDFGRIALDGHDLRFVDASGAVLAQDIELFDTQIGAIWIKIPTVLPDTDIELMMYFNNPSAPDITSQRSSVWDSSFASVHHMGQVIEDVSRQHNAANSNNPVGVTGVVGYGREFNPANSDRVTIGSIGFPLSNTDRTLCAWAQPTLFDGLVHYIVGYGNMGSNDGFYLARSGIDLFAGGSGDAISIPAVFGARWDYYCMTLDNLAVVRIYLGGALAHTSTHANWATTTGTAMIGGWSGGYWGGYIDEVRLSDNARGPAWIAAEALVVKTNVARFGQTEPP